MIQASKSEEGFLGWFDANIPLFTEIVQNNIGAWPCAVVGDGSQFRTLSMLNDRVFLAPMSVDGSKREATVDGFTIVTLDELKTKVAKKIYDEIKRVFPKNPNRICVAWVMRFEGAVKIQPFEVGQWKSVTQEECEKQNEKLLGRLVYTY